MDVTRKTARRRRVGAPMTTRPVLTLALTALACALAAPASSDAATFCVNKPGCVGTAKATPQEALDAAELNNVADTVYIGPKSTPYAGGLSYSDAEQVTILGSGASSTVIAATAGNPAFLVGNSHSRVEDLKIVHATVRGLTLGGVADDVTVTYNGVSADTTGVWLAPGGYFTGGAVSTLGAAVMAGGSGSSTIRNSYLSGRTGLVTELTDSSLSASRLTVSASYRGASTGGHLTLINSIIDLHGDGAEYGLVAGSNADVVAKHLTVLGPSSADGVAVLDTGGSAPAQLEIDSSIIHGFESPLAYYDNTADLIVRYSAYQGGYWADRGPGTFDIDTGHIAVAPVFAPSGSYVPSYRLLYPSALIDGGDPADTLIEDRAGAPRVVDGNGIFGARSDIGAFEYQRKAPTAAFTGPTSLAPGVSGQFSAAPSSDPDLGDKAGFKYSWSFADGATSTALSPSHAYASAGMYDVTLKVTDLSGLSDTHTVQVGVSMAVQQPGDPQDPGQPQDPQQPQDPAQPEDPQQPQGDALAPVVSHVAMKGRARRRLVRFNLSEDAAVLLRFKRKGARRVKRLGVRGKAGVNRVRFLRRLELTPGSYAISIRAADEAGNVTIKKAAVRFVLRRR